MWEVSACLVFAWDSLNGTLAEQGTNGESLAEMLTAEYSNRPSWPQLARDVAPATNGLAYVDIPILGGTNIPDKPHFGF